MRNLEQAGSSQQQDITHIREPYSKTEHFQDATTKTEGLQVKWKRKDSVAWHINLNNMVLKDLGFRTIVVLSYAGKQIS
jgi:hypothetical protein